ncbi:hypothetical protein FISHEDRAFT_57917 [Fistulina hepatica ATCC 64428]|uniref:Uncharacterized protein n=1 Tax=Fistulina hepatica ATCC 64428 TaxID=1128425 RepID=A0A0D7AET0_9AGAR|nr:hypothetical protein FISHEDRAFT_57917 [Fistulina hepatica ATCC 64428]
MIASMTVQSSTSPYGRPSGQFEAVLDDVQEEFVDLLSMIIDKIWGEIIETEMGVGVNTARVKIVGHAQGPMTLSSHETAQKCYLQQFFQVTIHTSSRCNKSEEQWEGRKFAPQQPQSGEARSGRNGLPVNCAPESRTMATYVKAEEAQVKADVDTDEESHAQVRNLRYDLLALSKRAPTDATAKPKNWSQRH